MLLNDSKELRAPAGGGLRTVIVGSGAAGLYAARELSERGHDVVVIESGGTGLDSFAPESYSSVGLTHDGIRIGRSRSLGGTTNLWGGQLVEFQPVDFGGRDWLPHSKWPVTYEEIAAYYKRTYENLGMSGDVLEDRRVFKQVFGSELEFEQGVEMFLTRWLKIPNFAVLYGKQIRTSKNLSVLLNHTVVGFAASNGQITAVRAIDGSGKTHLVEGDRFILAAGTIEICRLLLHGAATPGWDCPWRDNANVGAYFQDHLVGRIASVHPIDKRRFFDTFCNFIWSGNKYQPKIRLTNETLERTHILNIQGTFLFESSISENLVFLKQFLRAAIHSRKITGIGSLFKNLRACGKHLLPLMWKYVVENRIFVPSTSKISFGIQSEQTPLRESRITIDSSVTDVSGLPKVILDWKAGSEELASIREFAIRCDRALRAAGLAHITVVDDLANSEPGFIGMLHDIYHQTGGARMAESQEDGVVDRNLRVFGTRNLYVAGAASFRTTSNANVTFTALAFVTRLIDHLHLQAQEPRENQQLMKARGNV
jgi:choline dehydrogenase-like flavoprotein